MIDLQGSQILIAEDEFLIADLLDALVTDSGGEAVGPVSTVRDGFIVAEDRPLAGALLDINLADGQVYPLAFALQDREIPIIIMSGNNRSQLPPRLSTCPWVQKPVAMSRLLELMQANFIDGFR